MTTDVVIAYKRKRPDKTLRGLISFGRLGPHHGNLMMQFRHLLDDLILDSGTFTLYQNPQKHQTSITLEGYLLYLKQFAERFDFYFNFDDDFSTGGFKQNYSNQLYLENDGFEPVPVVHDCYGPEIATYINRGHKLIAIGSGELAHASVDDLYNIVKPIYDEGVKVHFLGCTEYDKLAYIPVYSADSTTWNRTGTSGRILYWNPERDGYKKKDDITLSRRVPIKKRKYVIWDYDCYPQLEDYLWSELRLKIADLHGTMRLLNRALVNVHYFVLLEELINQKHKEQGFSFE